MQVDGACHCGKVTFTAQVDPATVSVCHCTDCQTMSGAPFRASVPARAEDFVLKSGAPRIYVKTAQSGNRRAQGFCGDCGTPIYSAQEKDTPFYMLRVGVLDRRAELVPQLQIWHGSSQPWAQDISGLETRPGNAWLGPQLAK
jgi:hypothetical protein